MEISLSPETQAALLAAAEDVEGHPLLPEPKDAETVESTVQEDGE